MEPLKKKRKLFIVDIGEDGKPVQGMSQAPVVPPLPGIDKAHKDLKSYVQQLADYYKFTCIDQHILARADTILNARTPEEANSIIQEVSDNALHYFQNGGS